MNWQFTPYGWDMIAYRIQKVYTTGYELRFNIVFGYNLTQFNSI